MTLINTRKCPFFKDHGFTHKSRTLRKKGTHTYTHTQTNQGLPARLSCRLHSGTWHPVSPLEQLKPYTVYQKYRLMGIFQNCSRRLIVLLTPNEFVHSSTEAPRTTQARETSDSEGRNYYQGIQLANPEFTKVLSSFTCCKAGTWGRFFHFPSEERHAEDYSDTRELGYQRPAC